MTSERPPATPPVESTEDKERREQHEQQDHAEAAATERFLDEAIRPRTDLSDEQKDLIALHVKNKPGQWRHVNGDDVTLAEVIVEDDRIIFVINLYGMDVEDEILL